MKNCERIQARDGKECPFSTFQSNPDTIFHRIPIMMGEDLTMNRPFKMHIHGFARNLKNI